MEEWKTVPIEGFEDYQVSTYGNIKILARDIPTHFVNHGKDINVIAHRKEKNIIPCYECGRPIIRLRTREGTRRKFSLPLLLLKTFKMDECPGDVNLYTASYRDGNPRNNNIDNIFWVSRSELMSSIGVTLKGETPEHMIKYRNIIIKVHDNIVGYFKNTTLGAELFNSYGITTSASAIGRSLQEKTKFYVIFDFNEISDEEYDNIAITHNQTNLKLLYDIVMKDRHIYRKTPVPRVKSIVKTVVQKEVVYKDRIVKVKPEKEIVEKIVYVDKQTNQKTRKPYIRKKPIPKPKPKIKEVEDSYKDFIRDIEAEKKDRFKKELLRRMKQ